MCQAFARLFQVRPVDTASGSPKELIKNLDSWDEGLETTVFQEAFFTRTFCGDGNVPSLCFPVHEPIVYFKCGWWD